MENKRYGHLDYTFGDDRDRTMRKQGPQNLRTMKRAVPAMLSPVVAGAILDT
ncbi:MAG: hypothetical protein LBF75_06780 [Treponema sp.]|nr:hypothetical protein [Treponema sp.]